MGKLSNLAKQQVFTRSSAEVEFRSLVHGICEGIWLKHLITELKVNFEGTIEVICDNKSAIAIARNLICHDEMKHVDIDCHFISEKIEMDTINLRYVPSNK